MPSRYGLRRRGYEASPAPRQVTRLDNQPLFHPGVVAPPPELAPPQQAFGLSIDRRGQVWRYQPVEPGGPLGLTPIWHGAEGPPGPQGPPGPPGAQGPPGHGGGGIDEFDLAEIYGPGSLVIHNNKLYLANTGTGPGPFTPADWDQMASQADLATALAGYLPLSGGTLTGMLTLSGLPSIPGGAAGDVLTTDGSGVLSWVALSAGIPEPTTSGSYLRTNTGIWTAGLPLAGGVAMTGLYTLSGDATANLNPVPLQQLTSTLTGYVSTAALTAALGSYLPLTGGTLAGPGNLTINAATNSLTLNSATGAGGVIFQNNGAQQFRIVGNTANALVMYAANNGMAAQFGTIGTTRCDFYGQLQCQSVVNVQGLLTVSGGALFSATAVTINAPIVMNPASAPTSADSSITQCGLTQNIRQGAIGVLPPGGLRWIEYFGDATPQTGGNAGANYSLQRCSDGGGVLGAALSIERATGNTTLGGNVSISVTGNQTLTLNGTASSSVYFRRNGLNRWMVTSDATAEGGGNTGSNFTIYRYADDGAANVGLFSINRATMQVSVLGGLMYMANGSLSFSDMTVLGYANTNRRIKGWTWTSGIAGTNRWSIDLGDLTPESGGNVGSDFVVSRYSDAGVLMGTPLRMTRANGNIIVALPTTDPGVSGALWNNGGVVNVSP